ncbi:ribonucleoside-diphosphate reductase subunit alpha [Spirochaeta cellobiosiphila]|uniref:ribonucleoside-diphosphate reductase subunit alpha n=1 Tax=Spirochaeta cellobiosiphila TaxID=504483 RepID=UPI00040E5B67|nr:ribonucleoside-diphosphate reductase subunit alpha [Spirochaeta cellobiosiphila]
MYIVKRDGSKQEYFQVKIGDALTKAFHSADLEPSSSQLKQLLTDIETSLFQDQKSKQLITVEQIQDMVEQKLMAEGFYQVAKNYILYRDQHNKRREDRNALMMLIPECPNGNDPLLTLLLDIQNTYSEDVYHLGHLLHKYQAFYKPDLNRDKALELLVRAALELTVQEAPQWEYIASHLAYLRFQENLQPYLKEQNIANFYDKIAWLTDKGLYGDYILQNYTREDVEYFSQVMVEERNRLLTYSSLDILLKRYLIIDWQGRVIETPQELFMGIAMHLCMNEQQDRREWVIKTYDILSKLQVTMATPTLSNARKPFHQLSSCFIDTVPDSLDGIYRSINSFAQVSKFGGGMGLYFGKVRAVGSPIRGFKGAAGGVLRWIKLANDTAVAVDQLGVRQGAVAVYLDLWHKDIPEFLQLRTNNGDDRMKAHDVFPALCVPDYFWEQVNKGLEGEWQLMCPHEIQQSKGYHLEDFWGEEWTKRYKECLEDDTIDKRSIPIKDLVRMIIKSAVETGTPFIFNRDHVNRMNPNPHKGMIYCSNLCTEIAQNMSAVQSQSLTYTEEGDTVVIEKTLPGDFVVCNLASLVLGNIDTNKSGELEEIVNRIVRVLDNVIDLNFYPVTYAQITNKRYRSIGLGVNGYHHGLAKNKISWESKDHLEWADQIFERINYAAIQASSDLAKEKGSYAYFDGSDWAKGDYFDKRRYNSPSWVKLQEKVAQQGMRNAYLLAVAPTSSTSIVAGTTAGIDPIMNKYYLEEKKGMTVPRVAPDLNPSTFWLYKNAHNIDQDWSIKAAGIRQRHIDQSQSLNMYITTDFSLRQVLNLYLEAWKQGIKTIYYIRSKSLEVDDCDSCSA